MANFTRFFLVLLFLAANIGIVFSQSSGDFRSKTSGNWGDNTTWEVYNGVSWEDATTFPGGTSESDADNVYIESGHTVTLEGNHSCKDLHLNTTADVVRINTQDNTLDIWGEMRFYEGSAPGAGTPNPVTSSGITGWISSGSSGSLRFRGTANRIIMDDGQVNANNSNSGWNLDFAFDPGFIGEIKDRVRAGNITVSSGTLFVNDDFGQLRIGTNNGAGDATVNGQFLLKSGATVTGGAGIFKKSNTAAESITVEDGATLEITTSGYVLAAQTLNLDGTVILQNAINFPTEAGRAGASQVNTFNNLTLAGSGAKSLQNDVSVNGRLSLNGSASLNLNSQLLSYGASGELEYSGSSNQTSSDAEFPSSNGPNSLIINNPLGVNLHSSRTIEGQLTLTSGLLDLAGNNLTLGANSPAVSGTPSVSNMVISSGGGELRKIFTGSGSYLYPIGDTLGSDEYTFSQITVNSADQFDDGTYFGLRVNGTEHLGSASATDKISRYWGTSTNMTGLSYNGVFQYTDDDINGNESSIISFLFSDETALASRTSLADINDSLNQIIISDVSSSGFISGANFGCNISNNTVTPPGTIDYCGSASSILFDGTTAVVSSGTPTYQWQQSINGGEWTNIAVDGQSEDYTEPGPLASGTYGYRRIVSDPSYCAPENNSISNEVTLTVTAVISGNSIGSDQTISYPGDPDPLTTTGSITGGNGTFTYQWKRSFSQGGPYSSISGATSETYDIASGGIYKSTYYVRQVTSGSCSTTSNEVLISVSCGIVSHPDDVVTCIESNASFTAQGSGAGITYQWQASHNGGASFWNLSNNSLYSNVTSATLNLTSIPSSINGYLYRCKIQGNCDVSYTDPALLTINSPIITSQPVNRVVCETQNTTFDVTVSGISLNYQWQESSDGGDSFHNLSDGGIYSNTTTSSLTLTNINSSVNNYKYKCIITGSCEPSATTNTVTLTVNTMPAVDIHPSNSTICVGGNTSFSVTASGSNLTYQWQASLNGGAKYNNITNGSIYSNTTSTTVNLSSVPSKLNNYLFRCKVTGLSPCPDVYSNSALLTLNNCKFAAFDDTESVPEQSSVVNVYPNPFQNEINISSLNLEGTVTVLVKDLEGSLIYKKENVSTGENITLGNEWQAGIYFLQVFNNDNVYTFKIIKTY